MAHWAEWAPWDGSSAALTWGFTGGCSQIVEALGSSELRCWEAWASLPLHVAPACDLFGRVA